MNTKQQRHSLILDYTLDYIKEENEDEANEEDESIETDIQQYDENEMADCKNPDSLQNFKLKYMMKLNEDLRLPQHRSSLHYYQLHYLSEEEADSCDEDVPVFNTPGDEFDGHCGRSKNADETVHLIDRYFSPQRHAGL